MRQASNLGATEALERNVIDVMAPTLPELLDKVDGTKTVPKGLVLHTKDAEITNVDMSLWQKVLDTLIDPNLIVLFMSLGTLGLIVELWNPGLIFPGTVGAVSLILGLFGLQVLPINAAGALLMLLAFAFFAAEAFVPTHGAITLAGRGLLRLRRAAPLPAGGQHLRGLGPARRSASPSRSPAMMGLIAVKLVQVRRAPVVTGQSELVGQVGVVRQPLAPVGLVFVRGELWRARANGERVEPGTSVRVDEIDDDLVLESSRPRSNPVPSHRISDCMGALIALAAIAVFVLIVLASAIRVAREYERGVIFRLGRLKSPPKGPGLFLLIPIIDKMVRVDLRTVTLNVPPQEVITKDNVPVRVNAVAYFRIIDPEKAIVQVENFMVATSQIAQTTLRSVLGQHSLDELLSERDKINAILQQIIDEATSPWGIKISIVEVKDVEIPTGMQRAMARQAEAERERRAKVIAAEGEFQASERLKDAAMMLAENPMSLQLRFLQTMLEISSERSSTIILPLPIELFKPLLGGGSSS